MPTAKEVKQKYGDLLLNIPEVSGVGCPDGKFCVYVTNEKTMSLLKELLVKEIDGVTIMFKVTGKIIAYRKRQKV